MGLLRDGVMLAIALLRFGEVREHAVPVRKLVTDDRTLKLLDPSLELVVASAQPSRTLQQIADLGPLAREGGFN
jgi:hypothetical protein